MRIIRKSGFGTCAIVLLSFLASGAAGDDLKPDDIGPALQPILEKHALPALAAAVIADGQLHAVGAVGVRKAGTDVPVTTDDVFHLGSCTKAMTASMIGLLVEQGKLSWDLTLADAFPDLATEMHEDFRNVTLRQVLQHRAGLPANTPKGKTMLHLHLLAGTPREQRTALVKMLVTEPPVAKPGAKFLYSNAGYSLAGAIAERATDTDWRELMNKLLFQPLDMKSVGYGPMGRAGKVEQPWQHKPQGGKSVAIEPSRLADNPPVIGPAGRAHCSIGDWAKFAAAHLNGARGEAGLLSPELCQTLHSPEYGGDYACGWIVTERPWGGGQVLTHGGSNTMNYAVVWLAPKRNFGVLVATNQGGDAARSACDETAAAMIQKYVATTPPPQGRDK